MVKNISHYSTVPFKRVKCNLKLVVGLLFPKSFSSTKYLMLFYPKTPCCGSRSGIRCFFDPLIPDPGWKKIQNQVPGSGTNIPDLIFENLVLVFWVKILQFFCADLGPGSGILCILNPGWKKSNRGSCQQYQSFQFFCSRDRSLSYPPPSLMIGLPVRKPCVTALVTLT